MILYIVSHDPLQLNSERLKQTVFVDFIEGPIDFRPSYKYEPNTDNWDSR